VKKSKQKVVDQVLLYCPFCGGRSEFVSGGNYHPKLGRRVGVGVQCTECKVKSPFRQGLDAHARVAEHWNRRAQE
jgi:Lar family restriction alleviation protein